MTSVSTRAFYERATLDISALRAQAERLQSEMSRGEALSRSSDNPVAASRLRGLQRTDSFTAIDSTNANRASADLGVADGTLSSFTNYIMRAQELTTQAASGVLSPAQRSAIGIELGQLHQNLVGLANSRDSTGHALFGGETAGDAYSLDAAGNAVYIGTASAGEIALGDGLNVARGLTGPEFLNFNHNGVPTNLMAVVKGLADALQGGAADPAAAARDGLAALGTALDTANTGQTLVGARLAWIDLTTERRIDLSELRSGEEADLGGADLAATVTRLQEVLTVLEASQASFAKLSSLSLFDAIG